MNYCLVMKVLYPMVWGASEHPELLQRVGVLPSVNLMVVSNVSECGMAGM